MKVFYSTLSAITLALLLILALGQPPNARAQVSTPYIVTCSAEGVGPIYELNKAIIDANANPGPDSILIQTFDTGCTFTIYEPIGNFGAGEVALYPVTDPLTINGGNAIIERRIGDEYFRLIESQADLILRDLTLRQGAVVYASTDRAGGAIHAKTALTLTHVTLDSNTSFLGGAIYAEGPLTLDNVVMTGNRTYSAEPSHGGGAYTSSDLMATAITVTHNLAYCSCGRDKAEGGGIYVGGNATVANAYFGENTATESGGGLAVAGELHLSASTFYSNTAERAHGGGLYSSGQAMITDVHFVQNHARHGGGASFSEFLSVENSHFISNTASSQGGGLLLFEDSPGGSVRAVTFRGNRSDDSGGGLSGSKANMLVEASRFIDNQSNLGGGAVLWVGDVRNSYFAHNRSLGTQLYFGGGGLFVVDHATIRNNTFMNNIAVNNGGGISILHFGGDEGVGGGASLIINNLWIDNNAPTSAALHIGLDAPEIESGLAEISHNTIVRATRSAANAIMVEKGTAYVRNNIITRHTTAVTVGTDGEATVDANLLFDNLVSYAGVSAGENDIIADPFFVDPASSDFHLQAHSQAVDSGLNLGVSEDMEGIARPQGTGPDRGAYEYVNQAPVAVDDNYTVQANGLITVSAPGLLENDLDHEEDPLSAELVSDVVTGTLELAPDGGFTYAPPSGFSGTDRFTYRAHDTLGVSNPATVTILVEPPAEIPISDLAASNDSPTVLGDTTHFTATVSAGTNVSYTWDFGDGHSGSGVTVVHSYTANGAYTATVTATNPVGQETAQTMVVVNDAPATDVPIADLAASNDSPTALGNATRFTATVSAGTNVSYTWDFGDGNSDSGAHAAHSYTAAGEYTATVTATNPVGQETAQTVVVVNDAPATEVPIADLAASNDSPTALGNATRFTATVSAGTNVSYTWDFGDGNSDSGAHAAHLYTAAGEYTATVTATNPVGQATAQTMVVVNDTPATEVPIADLTVHREGPAVVGSAIRFEATVAAGTGVRYAWDFGNGETADGSSVSYVYAAPGAYMVTVQASNSQNSLEAATEVMVEETPAESNVYLPLVGR